MNDEPLIWTTKGNLPIKHLKYAASWENADAYIKFTERYFLGDELVKESNHVLMKEGVETKVLQGTFGG